MCWSPPHPPESINNKPIHISRQHPILIESSQPQLAGTCRRRKKNGEDFVQGSLFSKLEENPPLREAVDFYKHKYNSSNRLIAGNSLLVMNSLLENSGIVHLLDLALCVSSAIGPHMFLVAPDGREEEVRSQLRHPAFRDVSKLGLKFLLTVFSSNIANPCLVSARA